MCQEWSQVLYISCLIYYSHQLCEIVVFKLILQMKGIKVQRTQDISQGHATSEGKPRIFI